MTESKIIDVPRERDEVQLVSLCTRCGGECCNCRVCLAVKADTRDVCSACFKKSVTPGAA